MYRFTYVIVQNFCRPGLFYGHPNFKQYAYVLASRLSSTAETI